MSLKLNAIAAASENMGIGINGQLPWKLKSEMAFFSKMTTQTRDLNKKNVVIMGRKTWFGIPPKYRPLAGRFNVVLTRDATLNFGDDVLVRKDLDAAVEALSQPECREKYETVWVVGGSGVYKEAMERKDFHRLYLTEIKARFECDTFFPKLPEDLKPVIDPDVPAGENEENGIKFVYKVYEKV